MLFMFITFGCPIKTNFLKQICGQEVVLRPLFFFLLFTAILNLKDFKYKRATCSACVYKTGYNAQDIL